MCNSAADLTSPSWDPIKGRVSSEMRSGWPPGKSSHSGGQSEGTPKCWDASFLSSSRMEEQFKPILHSKLPLGPLKSDPKGSPIVLFPKTSSSQLLKKKTSLSPYNGEEKEVGSGKKRKKIHPQILPNSPS